MISGAAAAGIRERFAAVREARKHADDSIDAGRKYVATYVDFSHYIEKLDLAAASASDHEHAGEPPEKQEHLYQGH